MKRLEKIPKTNLLSGKRVIVTGCGYKELKHVFKDIVTNEPSHDSILIGGKRMKLNIGSAIAAVLARNGAIVHMVSTSEDKLRNIKNVFSKYVENNLLEYSSVDLLNEKKVIEFVKSFPKDKPIYWVQSVGLGAGSYKLKNDNPYLPLEEIPIDLLEKESQIVLRATHLMMKALLPIFKKQKETRVAIISSMSAIRGYSFGGTHTAAKGAIDRYSNSSMLGLYKNNIFVTTVRPGGVDTGMYDNKFVQESIKFVSDEYNGVYRKNQFYLPPIAAGQIVCNLLNVPAHITSVNIVAKGQFPNEGS